MDADEDIDSGNVDSRIRKKLENEFDQEGNDDNEDNELDQ